MIGTKVGPYEITEEIGKGGMATVYRAYQPSMDRFVAVKVINPAAVEEETVRQRFQREARLIARLEHPHVIPVYDFDGSHDPPYIVMRFLEGGTLKDAMAGNPLPFSEIAYLLSQIGPALDYAHRQGIIHRDIKPSNVMIDCEGNAFVMDFGIARMTAREELDTTFIKDGVIPEDGGSTGAGITMGTPDYMSPEQIMGLDNVDARADIYSLGAMLFEMTTGHLPFEGDASMSTMLMHLRDPVPSACVLNDQLPSEIEAVFQRAMAKEPGDRFKSVNTLTASLLRLLGGAVEGAPTRLRLAAMESANLLQDRLRKSDPPSISPEEPATPSEQNKTITAVYADAGEFAQYVDLRDGTEAAHREANRLWMSAARVVSDHGGVIFSQSHRDLLALWGSETAKEDDAEQAVRAALAIRDSIRYQVDAVMIDDRPLPIRIGVNTGLALLTMSADTGTFTASGGTINLASKVANIADGLVLITHDTFRQVRGIFEIEKDAPVRVMRSGERDLIDTYCVTAAKPRAFKIQPRGVEGISTRMVGRRSELEQLQKAYFNAVEESETQVVTVIGDAGLGKSRLLYEFATWAELRPEMYFIFRGRATATMTHRPYAMWRDLISFRFEILDNDDPVAVRKKMETGISKLIGPDDEMAHLMGYLAGFDFGDSPFLGGEPGAVAERARVAAGLFFQRLAALDPVVLQLDDLHHSDDASLDLLAEVVNRYENLRLLMVGMARRDLYQRRPTWGSGREYHLRINLRPLDKRDSRDLAAEILQKVIELPRDLRDLIVERAEGNPYYLEELVKMLIEDRVIQKLDEAHWTVESSRLERLKVPPTLVSLLQTRFDSLLYPEKLTLQRASVIGRIFYDSTLEALDIADQTHVDDLQSVLRRLTKREFIYQRETSAFAGSREYIFAQAMLRDLIVETLLQKQVGLYSRATAEWLAAQSGERAGEYDALIGEHYETSGKASLAADYYQKAGNTAVGHGALDEGIKLFERGLSLLEGVEGTELAIHRLGLQLNLSGLYGWKGVYDEAYALLKPALNTARKLDDRLSEANALAQLGRIAGSWRGDFSTGQTYLEQALPIARELDDQPTLTFILRQIGNLAYITGRYDLAMNYLEESLGLARELRNLPGVANALNSLGECARFQGDYDSALDYYHKALDILQELGNPNMIALVNTNIGYLYLDQGNFTAAGEIGQQTLHLTRKMGVEYLVAGCLQIMGGAAVGLGEKEAAHRYLDEALGMSWSMGNFPNLLFTIPDRARLLALEGEDERALEWLGLALAHPSLTPDGKRRVNQALAELSNKQSEITVSDALTRGSEQDLGEMLTGLFDKRNRSPSA